LQSQLLSKPRQDKHLIPGESGVRRERGREREREREICVLYVNHTSIKEARKKNTL
jgi:hypothetical protein